MIDSSMIPIPEIELRYSADTSIVVMESPNLYSVLESATENDVYVMKYLLLKNPSTHVCKLVKRFTRLNSDTLSPAFDTIQENVEENVSTNLGDVMRAYIDNTFAKYRGKVTSQCAGIYENLKSQLLTQSISKILSSADKSLKIIADFALSEQKILISKMQMRRARRLTIESDKLISIMIQEQKENRKHRTVHHHYQVSVMTDGSLTCNCRKSAQDTTILCTHIICVLKMLDADKSEVSDNLIKIYSLSESAYKLKFEVFNYEIKRIISHFKEKLQIYQRNTATNRFAPNKEKEDVCPICLINIEKDHMENVVSCPICRNNVHVACLNQYLNSSITRRCVMCRNESAFAGYIIH